MDQTFVDKIYGDGDKDIYVPYWKEVIQDESISSNKKNLDLELERNMFISEDEIALKHPKTGSTIKLRDDGAIEMYVNEDTGMRMDPKDNAIVFFGDIVHFATKEMRIHTKPHNFIWNNHNFNPYFYFGEKQGKNRKIPKLFTTLDDSSLDGNNLEDSIRRVPLFEEQKRKHYYDDKAKQIMREIGIDFNTGRG